MSYRHCCVIDTEGYYKTFVLVQSEPDEEGVPVDEIQYYTLAEGETLLDAAPPTDFVKPCWSGTEWEEKATPEELAAWEEEHPAPPLPEPSPVDVLGAQVAQLTIDNIQKDQIINALGEQLAQTSLDVMTMKGGV